MIRGVKTLKAAAKPQTTFLCLSSANSVYIQTILEVCAVRRRCVI
jgi:pyridoxal phosphate phosphatase PHOSPHO2